MKTSENQPAAGYFSVACRGMTDIQGISPISSDYSPLWTILPCHRESSAEGRETYGIFPLVILKSATRGE